MESRDGRVRREHEVPRHRQELQAWPQQHRLRQLQVDELLGLLPPSQHRQEARRQGCGRQEQGQACRHLARSDWIRAAALLPEHVHRHGRSCDPGEQPEGTPEGRLLHLRVHAKVGHEAGHQPLGQRGQHSPCRVMHRFGR